LRIKKLELVGFKSFKDRTVILFDAGITGIVGPNGCGKSNIIDALLWVMGEQSAKHLRGSSMEDVIFNGAEGFAASGMAEVSITLENDGGPFPAKYMNYSEISATRRLHRSGESEYLINREAARLRDIQEIFMDTGAGSKGFSIVEQGAIGKIITAKPDDRRTLIEEAAGITKFKVRKRESQKKLEATDQNLVRLHDIVGELKRQLESLEKQARRAERYRELKRRLEDLDIWLSSRKYRELNETLVTAQNTLQQAQEAEISDRSELETGEARLQVLQLHVLEKEKDLLAKQQRFTDLNQNIQKIEAEIQNLKFEVESGRRSAEMQGSLRQETELRHEVLLRESSDIAARLEEALNLATTLQSDFEVADQEYREADERLKEIDQELTNSRRDLLATTQSESHLQAQAQVSESRLEEFTEKAETASKILIELSGRKNEFEDRRNRTFAELEKERQLQLDIMTDVENFEANKAILVGDVALKEDEVQQNKDELNSVTSRLYGLEKLQLNFEGFEDGVKSILMWQRKRDEAQAAAPGSAPGGRLDPLSERFEVEPEFELAMSAALGERLQTLVATDTAVGLAAIQELKSQKSGRSTFAVLDMLPAISENEAMPTGDGVVGRLMDHIRCATEHEKIAKNLLGRVCVVETLAHALALKPQFPNWSFVTKDGDVLSFDGLLTAGSSESAQSGLIQRRREIKELTTSKDEWSQKLQVSQIELENLSERLETVQKDLENAQKVKMEREIAIASKKKDLERAEQELQNLLQTVTRQEREVQGFEQQRDSHAVKLTELKTHLAGLTEKRGELERETEALNIELLQTRNGFETLRDRATTLQVSVAQKKQEISGLTQQDEMFKRNLAQVTDQLSRMDVDAETNATSLSRNQIDLENRRVQFDQLVSVAQQLAGEISEQKNLFEESSHEARELDMSLMDRRRRSSDLKITMNEAQMKMEEARLNEKFLVEQIREKYIVELSEVAPKYYDRQDDVAAGQIELDDLKDKVKKIGDVNLSAIEEFDDISKRYKFLSQQQEDLLEAKDQLRRVIDRINRICSKRFRDTFDAVNERFTKVFPVLFGGGEARLILVEDPEKDDMGIDIVARPPGKKPQSITLLSGGEKALTAVSLIFSIFLVKPSPFCLLDEVDAPLDDANVYRFNDLVREMAKRSQIIVITHNKNTMEINERLYGVTQEERGISKMVSVDLKRAIEVAAQ
jgi:chromosome segregation protein